MQTGLDAEPTVCRLGCTLTGLDTDHTDFIPDWIYTVPVLDSVDAD